MNAHPATGNGALLLDGARHENATAWLYQRFPTHQPWPLLLGTDYEPIADAGPILLDAPQGSPVYEAWRHGSDIEDGVWLQSDAALDDLQRILQRRLRIFTPERGELWLRLGDACPLYRAWQSGAQWPEGFWHGVQGVWLRDGTGIFCAWHNDRPQQDGAPDDLGIAAQLTLDWPLLQALANQDDIAQDAKP
ncbi:hypothetical protein CXK94_02455 [Stutzerimonas stutzeri]|uniref:DUF4123 domain-containing protein n=1 Tax=Stutzerimonas stutzeri TaxID=316 RepID=A0A2N8T9S3_STUST|nr:DUF4123 domain-containing protein [Stutzerimonas stutzeri]MCQ4326390.1 DUF4123 domain-containing protein [Stutzerimonas stutzeri]PNG11462.1 hypothetical protein CXK94_02455 [Stutzerimonas stutzeri]